MGSEGWWERLTGQAQTARLTRLADEAAEGFQPVEMPVEGGTSDETACGNLAQAGRIALFFEVGANERIHGQSGNLIHVLLSIHIVCILLHYTREENESSISQKS